MEDLRRGGDYDRRDIYGDTPVAKPAADAPDAAISQTPEANHEDALLDTIAVTALVEFVQRTPQPDEEPSRIHVDRVRKRGLIAQVIDQANFLIGDNDETKQFHTISRMIRTLEARERQQRDRQNRYRA